MLKHVRQIVSKVVQVGRSTVEIWLRAQAFVYAGSLAFFTIFSLAPIALVAVTLIGLVFGERAAQGELLSQLEIYMGSNAAEVVQTVISNSALKQGGILTIVAGIGAMLFGATTVFAQLQTSLNSIWGVAPKSTQSGWRVYLIRRLLSLSVVLGIGLVLLLSMGLSLGVRLFMTWTQDWLPGQEMLMLGADWLLSLIVMSALFAAIFKILPDVILPWRYVLVGAVATALMFIVGRSMILTYLSRSETHSAYGAAGSLVLLLLWVYYSSLILFAGAALTRALAQLKNVRIEPRKSATHVVRELAS
ncbi:YihY/virulence factor BrkB family protein [Orrella sp. 11846]|uniref:YihY/virulence factor BrkB family protein n=1 Tax=Orrella sp. 11846 TaxID=3409913 RepID=UPI003B59E79D